MDSLSFCRLLDHNKIQLHIFFSFSRLIFQSPKNWIHNKSTAVDLGLLLDPTFTISVLTYSLVLWTCAMQLPCHLRQWLLDDADGFVLLVMLRAFPRYQADSGP